MKTLNVVDVYPPDVPGKRPTCEAKLGRWTTERNEEWVRRGLKTRRNRRKVPPDQCDTAARYKIGSKWLCRKHAAYVLLDSLAAKGE